MLKSPEQVQRIQDSCSLLKEAFLFVGPYVQEGISTKELDRLLEDFILKQGGKPSFKGYMGFPYSSCISVNDAVIHGVPSTYQLQVGDLVSLDCGINFKGYYSDCAKTYAIGSVSPLEQNLLTVTEKALLIGIQTMGPRARLKDLSQAIFAEAQAHNLGVIKEYTGHGVGLSLHEDPPIPNYPFSGPNRLMQNGLVWAIEPMFTLGSPQIYLDKGDGWTVRTRDKSKAAHFEHTVAMVDNQVCILT